MLLTGSVKILNSNVQLNPKKEAVTFFDGFFNFIAMKEILLSQHGKNRGKYTAIVDDEDSERVNQFNWYVHKEVNVLYARRNVLIDGKIKQEYMHQFIMGEKMIDHADGCGLNCWRSNMRKCNNSQNGMNRRPNKNCSSKYKGVYFEKNRNKWKSRIKLNGNLIFLGHFGNEMDAAKTYDKKAVELFGEFARLNFP